PLLSTAAVGSLSVSARRTDRLRRRLSLAAQPIPSPALYAPTFRNSGGRSALTYGSNLSAHRSGASGLIAARRPRASLSADNGVELSPLPSINSSTDTFGCFPWAAIGQTHNAPKSKVMTGAVSLGRLIREPKTMRYQSAFQAIGGAH